MDILKMLSDLRQEREQIEQAIIVIERLASGQGKRRGRPPASGASETEHMPGRRGRRMFTPAQRKAQADRMRAMWAAKRKAAKG